MSVQTVGKFLLTVVLVMVGIYLVKQASIKLNIPVLRTISEGI